VRSEFIGDSDPIVILLAGEFYGRIPSGTRQVFTPSRRNELRLGGRIGPGQRRPAAAHRPRSGAEIMLPAVRIDDQDAAADYPEIIALNRPRDASHMMTLYHCSG
jgi:hypothetical protein